MNKEDYKYKLDTKELKAHIFNEFFRLTDKY